MPTFKDPAEASNLLIAALRPIVARVRTDTCWIVNSGQTPRCIKEPLTEAKLVNHVNGGPRFGVAPIKPGSSVTSVGLLDFDSHQGELSWAEMKITVLKVMEILRCLGASPIPFKSSGGRGVHLYVIWETPQDAYSVRSFLRSALASAGFSDGAGGVAQGKVEVFPKQNAVAEGKFGNMFILPLGGKSVPLEASTLDDLDKSNAHLINWPVSAEVPAVTPPKSHAEIPLSTADVEQKLLKLSSALDAIPYGGADKFGYHRFLNFVLAIHHASGGSSGGLKLAHSFFQRADEYDGGEIDHLWLNAESNPNGIRPVTSATIYYEARQHGWSESSEHDFDNVGTGPRPPGEQPPPSFVCDDRGAIRLSMDNMVKAIERPDLCGLVLGYDAFRDEIMCSIDGGANWIPFKDSNYTELRINLERMGFRLPPRELTRDAVLFVAMANQFDSAQVWLNGLVWDGVKRIETFPEAHIGVEDTQYHRAVGRYLWTALAGRVLSPGCKADMAPVLVGRQGTRKSSAVAAMAPDPKFFTEISFSERDDDLSRKMRGRLIAEIAELRGLRTRESEHVKALITKQHEEWIPKYREYKTVYPRRIVFIGTTNQEEFLADETGNRRWLPIRVEKTIDVDRITRDCPQLWAEGRELFLAGGIDYQEAELLAIHVHAEYMIGDSWLQKVASWLEGEDFWREAPSKRSYLQTHEVLQDALHIPARNWGKPEEMRVGKILRALGYKRAKRRVQGKSTWVYVPTVPIVPPHKGTRKAPE
jgi:predicted P-loop ATPase